MWTVIAFLFVMTLVAIALDEPGRWRGWPAAAVEYPLSEGGEPPACGEPYVDAHYFKYHGRRWLLLYQRPDGHAFRFEFGAGDIAELQKEMVRMELDADEAWTAADTDLALLRLEQEFLRLEQKLTKQPKTKLAE